MFNNLLQKRYFVVSVNCSFSDSYPSNANWLLYSL